LPNRYAFRHGAARQVEVNKARSSCVPSTTIQLTLTVTADDIITPPQKDRVGCGKFTLIAAAAIAFGSI